MSWDNTASEYQRSCRDFVKESKLALKRAIETGDTDQIVRATQLLIRDEMELAQSYKLGYR